MKDYKMIAVIGGGPVGCFLAWKLAEKGKDVHIFEEHPVIGKPVQCTGILTKEIRKIVDIEDEFLLNEIKKVKVYSKRALSEFEVDDIVIDRAKFDKYLAKMARKAGAKIHLNSKFLGYEDDGIIIQDTKSKRKKRVDADAIVGADGPLSEVAKSSGMYGKRDFYVGVQARVKGNFDDRYEVYLGSIAPGFFAWVVPESSRIARIGVAGKKYSSKVFKRFLDVKNIDKKDIISKQAGLIPVWKKVKISKGNVFLVGDAAMQVKATTGGGIVPGLKAADKLADCLSDGGDYGKAVRGIENELWLHSKIRQFLNNFSDRDYDKLIRLLSGVKKELKNRDMLLRSAFKIILKQPRLLLFLRKTYK
ncbi:geranylgeranyl reductase family protein [Candidatus Woesearchaeota archaeon]|nr:geranylgeranyl reductase family protein [Candidatus Woesearchaeota archaeon]